MGRRMYKRAESLWEDFLGTRSNHLSLRMSGQNNSQPPGGAPAGVPSSANLPQPGGLAGVSSGTASNAITGPTAVASSLNATTSASIPVPQASLANAQVPNLIELRRSTNPPQANTYTKGNPVSVSPLQAARLSNIPGTLEYPVRAGLRTSGAQNKVLTNHFEMTLDRKTAFYEYQILGIPDSASRASKERYMETVIQSVPFLNNNQAFFATDNVNTIISWKDLHQFANGPQVHTGHAVTSAGAEWRLIDIMDGTTISSLNFQYLRSVDITQFQSYSTTNHPAPATYDSHPTEYALNTIMRKCIDGPNTLHLNNHRFYLRDAYFDLRAGNVSGNVTALRALRGYTYRVKPSMGKILLNVSPAMSAFWRPLPISDLMRNNNAGLASIPRGLRALRNLKVYIMYRRGITKQSQTSDVNSPQSRIKTIRGFGKSCATQTFKFQQRNSQGQPIGNPAPITVQNYQLIVYGRTLQFPNLPAVNVGTPQQETWFAPEDLCLLPDQIYARTIPDAFANSFHLESCRPPMEIRARIEGEGLRHIPRIGQNQLVSASF
jgi:eukaryotic translation initiation factor 2C